MAARHFSRRVGRPRYLMLCRFLNSLKQLIKHIVYPVVAHIFLDRGDGLEPGQGSADLGLAHGALSREDRSYRAELKVQRQYLPGEASNRLDQINHDFSFESIHRHGDFSIAPTAVARRARLPNDQLSERSLSCRSNVNASDGRRG